MTRTGWHLCHLAYWVWKFTPLWDRPGWYYRAHNWLLSWAGVYAYSESLEEFNAEHARFGDGKCQAPD